MNNNNKLDTLQENLARDLVHLEENESLSEQQMDSITEAYSQVYDIITKLKFL
jgi:hypothetical protein